MASQDRRRPSLYHQVDQSNPHSSSAFISDPIPNPKATQSPSSSLYPTIDTSNNNLFPANLRDPHLRPATPSAPPMPVEETLITIPGAIVHLIDKQYSVELGTGYFSVIRTCQENNLYTVFARVSQDVQWPLMNDVAIVKVDDSHYFFSFPDVGALKEGSDLLNYGLSFASKGQETLLKELDGFFESYGNFSVQGVSEKSKEGVAGIAVAGETSPEDFKSDEGKREIMARNCGAYWTTLAPNVEEYSGITAQLVAAGSGKLIMGILWCGDVAVDRLNWGHEILKKRIDPSEKMEIDDNTLKRIQRVKRMSIRTTKMANGLLTGVVKVSGFFTGSIANSKIGKKVFRFLPGEVILASLDGFTRICDAAEVAGKSVISTSSTVTTDLATHKYGEEAGKATQEGLSAAGHAIDTAWTVFKIRKALNPKSAIRATTVAKSAAKEAAEEYKSQSKKTSK